VNSLGDPAILTLLITLTAGLSSYSSCNTEPAGLDGGPDGLQGEGVPCELRPGDGPLQLDLPDTPGAADVHDLAIETLPAAEVVDLVPDSLETMDAVTSVPGTTCVTTTTCAP